ncbi:MAG: hypothetical protein ACREL7_07790 [Longimicrobiales bacterium]
MIVPNVRHSFDRADAAFVVWLLARGGETERDRLEARLQEDGFDAILDDPRTLNAVLAGREFSSASPELVFYLLVRHALLEESIHDVVLADYLTALLVAFGRSDRATSPGQEGKAFHHLVDLVEAGDASSGTRAFLLRAHLGEYALWLSGLFPDHITARVQRRGAPGIGYFEELGSKGYRLASRFEEAEKHGLDDVYRTCADAFPALRVALNRIADRHLFPATGDRIERLLRQITDRFDH